MAAYGLYTHIASNKFRSMLLLGGLFLLIYVLVYAGALLAEVLINSNGSVDYYLRAAFRDLITAAPYATIAAALWIVIAYFFHQNMIDAVTGGEDVTRQQQPRLYNLLENLCISRGIPMPKLKVMDSPALNAFATGLNRRQYAVTVTTGLLNALNDHEIEAVLGHELTHIRNGDVQLMVVAVIIAGVVGFFGELFFRMFTNLSWSGGWGSSSSSSRSSSSSDSDSKSSGGGAVIVVIIAIALIVVAWLLSQVVKLALSRSREFLADAGSVELTKDPDAMISALRKIENRGELPERPPPSWNFASTTRARALPICSRPIRRWIRVSRRWSNSPAATTRARWRCRRTHRATATIRASQPISQPPTRPRRLFPAAPGAIRANPPAVCRETRRLCLPPLGPWGRHG